MLLQPFMSPRGCSNGHRGFYTSCCIHNGDANAIIRVLVSLPVFTIAKGKGAGGGMSHPLCPATSYVRPWPHPLPIASSNSHPEGEPAPGPPRFWQGFFTDDVLQWSHIRIYETNGHASIKELLWKVDWHNPGWSQNMLEIKQVEKGEHTKSMVEKQLVGMPILNSGPRLLARLAPYADCRAEVQVDAA